MAVKLFSTTGRKVLVGVTVARVPLKKKKQKTKA